MLSQCLRASLVHQRRVVVSCRHEYLLSAGPISASTTWITQHRKYAKTLTPNLDTALLKIAMKLKYNRPIKLREIDTMIAEFNKCPRVSSHHALSVIQCFGSILVEEIPAVRMQLLKDTWKHITEIECDMSILHYNELLRVFVDNEYDFTPDNFLATIRAAGMQPNAQTYEILIVHFCRKGDIGGAKHVLQLMIEEGFPANPRIVDSLILCYGQAGDVELARKQFDVIKESGGNVSYHTIISLLCAYAKNGMIDEILDEIKHHKSNGINFYQSQYLQIVYAFSTNGHTMAAIQFIPSVIIDIGRDHEIFRTIVRLIQKNIVDVAYELLVLLQQHRPHDAIADMADDFINQLAKSECALKTRIEYIDKLHKLTGTSSNYSILLEGYLQKDFCSEDYLNLLRMLKSKSMRMKSKYFRPFFQKDTEKDYIKWLRLIKEEFEFQPTMQFLSECILSSVDIQRPSEVLQNLIHVKIKRLVAIEAVTFACLQRHQMLDAAHIVRMNPAFLHSDVFGPVIIKALLATNDFDAFIELIRNMYKNFDLLRCARRDDRENMAGQMVYEAMISFHRDVYVENTIRILNAFRHEGISITSKYAMQIQREFPPDVATDLFPLLFELVYGKLQLVENRQKKQPINEQTQTATETVTDTNAIKSNAIQSLEAAIISRDTMSMQNYYKTLHHDDFVHIVTIVALIKALIEENALHAAKEVVISVLRKNISIPGFIQILGRLADAGEVEMLKEIETHFSTDPENPPVSILPMLVYAYVRAARVDAIIPEMAERLQRCTSSSQLQVLGNHFPTQILYTLLVKHPLLEPKFEALAKEYAARGIIDPFVVLWYRRILDNNEMASRQIYKDHLQSLPTAPRCTMILSHATKNADPRPVQLLIDQLKSTRAHHVDLAASFKSLLCILSSNQRFDEAADVLRDAIEYMGQEKIPRVVLIAIENGLKSEGKHLPFEKSMFNHECI